MTTHADPMTVPAVPAPHTAERLAEIRQRASAATPGPWLWNGDVDNHSMRLSAAHSGRYTVMDLARWGMADAKARFQIKGRGMVPANELVQFEVCADATERSDPRVYRGDYRAIRHPDAEFIAHSRADVDLLLAEVDRLAGALAEIRAIHDEWGDVDVEDSDDLELWERFSRILVGAR